MKDSETTYDGLPCKRCGNTLRYKCNRNCVFCKRTRPVNLEQRAAYRKSDAGKAVSRKHLLKKKYGITEKEYQQMLLQQGMTCAACSTAPTKNKSLCVDHNHKTGKVRGLLCSFCNLVVGWVKDDPTILRHIITYLETS